MAGLPDVVRRVAEMSPVEDLLVAILRERLSGVNVQTLISNRQSWPLVLVRRMPQIGIWEGDARFVDQADVVIHCFAVDPDGDQDAAILAEAVRVSLRDAAAAKAGAPGIGYLVGFAMTSAPRRAPDFASAQGPVQYASLPDGVWRYETVYRIEIRRPRARRTP